MAILILLCACTAPRDSATHFGKPKYEVQTGPKARQGVPAVRQDWWSRQWFWQRRYTPYNRSIR